MSQYGEQFTYRCLVWVPLIKTPIFTKHKPNSKVIRFMLINSNGSAYDRNIRKELEKMFVGKPYSVLLNSIKDKHNERMFRLCGRPQQC